MKFAVILCYGLLCARLLFGGVFSFGGKPAANVTLLFVLRNDRLHLCGEGRLQIRQFGGDILMYRGFGDAEYRCCRTDGCAVFDDVFSESDGAEVEFFVDVWVFMRMFFQNAHSLWDDVSAKTYAAAGCFMISNSQQAEKCYCILPQSVV